MLNRISISNFKGIKGPTVIEFSPITLLFGANSAGKSTVLHSLLYSREIFLNLNLNPVQTELGGGFINLGGFTNLIYMHDNSSPISFRYYLPNQITHALSKDILPTLSTLSINWQKIANIKEFWLDISLAWREREHFVYVSQIGVGYGKDILLSLKSEIINKFTTTYTISEISHELLHGLDVEGTEADSELREQLDKIGNSVKLRQSTIEDTSFSDEKDYFRIENYNPVSSEQLQFNFAFEELKFINESEVKVSNELLHLTFWLFYQLRSSLKTSLSKLVYFGPVRQLPFRDFIAESSHKTSRWSDGSGAWDELTYNWDLMNELNNWLKQLGINYTAQRVFSLEMFSEIFYGIRDVLDKNQFSEEAFHKIKNNFNRDVLKKMNVKLFDERKGVLLSPYDTGFGVSQVIPVITGVLSSRKLPNTIMAVEQPELHLHPAAQVELGDLFIAGTESFRDSGDRNLYLIETHSEHLILRILRRIASGYREKRKAKISKKSGENNFKFTNKHLSVYWCAVGEEGTTFKKMEVTEDGEFATHWPSGFFTERYKELNTDE